MSKLTLFITFVTILFLGFASQRLVDSTIENRLIPIPIESSPLKNIPMESFVRFEKLFFNHNNTETYVGVGSGVVVARTAAGNVILTNFHVCRDSFETLMMLGRPTQKRVRDTHDRIFYVYEIRADENVDICLVFAKSMQAPPIKIAKKPPERGEMVFNISAPRGIFFPDASGDNGMAPIIIGVFNGYVVNDRLSAKSALYTINIAPGSSGSGIFNSDGELLGLVHSAFVDYNNLCLGVSYADIIKFLTPK